MPLQKSEDLLQTVSYFLDSLLNIKGLRMSTLRQPNQGWWYKTAWQQQKMGTGSSLGSSSAEKAQGAMGDSNFTQDSLVCINNSSGKTPTNRSKVGDGSPGWSGLEHLFCEENLRNSGLFSVGKRQVQGDITAVPGAYGEVSKSQSQVLYNGAWWEDERQWA